MLSGRFAAAFRWCKKPQSGDGGGNAFEILTVTVTL
jgi:hypothetical protein